MEQRSFNYSMKNIPLSNVKSYKKRFIEKMESLHKRMRWSLIHCKNKSIGDQKETYGFRTSKSPDQQEELVPFENDMQELLRDIKFKGKRSEFQKQLASDVKEIKSSKQIYVHADKSTNLYTMSKESYQKMLTDNITKTYKKASDSLKKDIDLEGSVIARKLEIADRMEVFAERKPFITLKDHKSNFDAKPTCRLINPAKGEMGIVSQQILKRINSEIRSVTKLNQWQNTAEVIDWYKKLRNKKNRTFIKFDIESFYPSITEETLCKAMEWAKTITDISSSDEEIIMHSRRSLLFNGGSNWVKQDGIDFDVTMGSYDGAEVCELAGLYMLHLFSERFDQNDLGLYRDDGITAQSLTRRQADKARKDIVRTFKSCGFGITIETMLPQTDFLDVTFDLPSEKYWPYRKPNNEPLYVNVRSNHPPVVLKHLPTNITERLSSISCDKNEFDKSKLIYEEALKKSGFDGNMTFIDPATKTNKRRRTRKNIIWFNPPFDQNVTTNVAKRFLQLLDKHFPKGHSLHKLFNRNTVKVSYSCMNNMASIISSHNAKILNSDSEINNGAKTCNCRKPDECPLNGVCLTESIVYKASVSANNIPTKVYYGLTENDFKTRWRNHKTSFTNAKYKKQTELACYIWELNEKHGLSYKNGDINVSWSIEQRSSKYKCGTRRCDLCLSEKLIIATADRSSLLNSRAEIVSTCRHRTKFRYDKVKYDEVKKKRLARGQNP